MRWTLAEGRIDRNRAEALATIAKIERRMEMERLLRGPRTGSAAHLLDQQPRESAAIFTAVRVSRNPGVPMATRTFRARVIQWLRIAARALREWRP